MKKVLLWFFAFVSILCLGCSLTKISAKTAPTVKTSQTATVTNLDPVAIKFEGTYTEGFEASAKYGFAIAVGTHTVEEMQSFVINETALVTYSYYVADGKFEIVVKNIAQKNYNSVITVMALVNEDDYITFANNVLNQNIADLLRPEEDCLHTILTKEATVDYSKILETGNVDITFYAEHLGSSDDVIDYGFALAFGTKAYTLTEMKDYVAANKVAIMYTNNVDNKVFKIKVQNIAKANFDKYITVVGIAKTASGKIYAINAYSVKVFDLMIEQGYQSLTIDGGAATLSSDNKTVTKLTFNAEYVGNFEEGTKFGFAFVLGEYTKAQMVDFVEAGKALVAYTTDVHDQKYKAIIGNIAKKYYTSDITVLPLAYENDHYVYGDFVTNANVLDLLEDAGYVAPALTLGEGATVGTKDDFKIKYTATYSNTLSLSENAKYGVAICLGKYTTAEMQAFVKAGKALVAYTDQLTGTSYDILINKIAKSNYNKYITVMALIDDEGYITYSEAETDRVKDMLIAAHLCGEVKAIDGASISTSSPVGLKFQAEVVTAFDEGAKYGFAIVIGSYTYEEMIQKIENGDLDVYYNTNGLGLDNKYAFTIMNIPASYYDKKITCLAVVKDADGDYNYADKAVTRSIKEVALAAYEADPTYLDSDNLIKTIVESCPIKVENGTANPKFYNSVSELTVVAGDVITINSTEALVGELNIAVDNVTLKGNYDKVTVTTDKIAVENAAKTEIKYYTTTPTLVAGDTVNLPSGKYSDGLTISVDNITINGYYANVDANSSERVEASETNIIKTIIIRKGVKNFTVNGVKITAGNSIRIVDSGHENITVKNCILAYASTTAIYTLKDVDAATDIENKNLVFTNNKFVGTASSGKDINLNYIVNGLTITGNTFTDARTAWADETYSIKVQEYAADSTIIIKDNKFNKTYVANLIDIGENDNTSSKPAPRKITLTIENNEMQNSYSDEFTGNGINVRYVGEGSVINILHNTKFRTSSYRNAIMISSTNRANSSATALTNATVNIKYNHFYAYIGDNTNIVRSTIKTSKYTRIGISLGTSATITFDNNYIGSTASVMTYYGTNKSVESCTSLEFSTEVSDYKAENTTAANNAYKASLN